MVAARKIEIDGIADSVSGHARRLGLSRGALWNRLFHYGWTERRACNTPLQPVAKDVSRALRAAEMRARGTAARGIAVALGVSERSAYRLVRAAWDTPGRAFCESWDDVSYWVPERKGGPMLYEVTGVTVVPLMRDDASADVAREPMLLRRGGGQWLDRRSVPPVIRAELTEWLEADS